MDVKQILSVKGLPWELGAPVRLVLQFGSQVGLSLDQRCFMGTTTMVR